jgi:hypothetical protein
MLPEDPPEAYEDYFTIDDLEKCEIGYTATAEDISHYRNEPDKDIRIQLAYEYFIGKDDLYDEDYKAILDDIFESLRQCEEDRWKD